MGGVGKDTGKHSDKNPTGGAGACPCRECPLHSPGPIDELIAALREASLNPVRPRHHGLNPFPDEDRRKPKVKIPPSFQRITR